MTTRQRISKKPGYEYKRPQKVRLASICSLAVLTERENELAFLTQVLASLAPVYSESAAIQSVIRDALEDADSVLDLVARAASDTSQIELSDRMGRRIDNMRQLVMDFASSVCCGEGTHPDEFGGVRSSPFQHGNFYEWESASP